VLVRHYLHELQQSKGRKVRVLDVGCGNGALARHLPPEQFEYVGTDISDAAIEEAKKHAPWGTFYQSSMDDEPPSGELYDIIIFCEVLVYVDYDTVLQRYRPLLKDDGALVISLYDVWRTKLIWRNILRHLLVQKRVYVRDLGRKVGWTVAVAAYKDNQMSK
jgi:2-polyprenyl-3-methyl-5-hydroxy-6-metoxy-1,4-benzoquinol methylase